MCSTEPTRREAIRLGTLGAVGLLGLAGCGSPLSVLPLAPLTLDGTVEVMPGLRIHPRSSWGADLAPKADFEHEQVRFVLVHHTQTPNDYGDPRPVIRSVYAYHTSSAKRWGDVAYHFFVGRDGSVWEGRAGSLDGPVVADATAGNQGWAQLVCLIGNHIDAPPTEAAQASLVDVLKWITWRYRLDTDPAATAEYVSRGSNRFAAGTPVVTPVISGHRDATYTDCPGDAAYRLLPTWRQRVHATPDPVFPSTGPYLPARRLGVIEP